MGEANNLKIRDVDAFTDDKGRSNFRITVKGKTGKREAVMFVTGNDIMKSLLEFRANAGASPDDWLFVMPKGTKIITLIDQKFLGLIGVDRNSHGERYTLYSLRHYYAVQALRNGISIYSVAQNMGTSVQIIQTYYARSATNREFATQLGGDFDTIDWNLD